MATTGRGVSHLSQRISKNLVPDKLGEVRAYVWDKQYDPDTNPAGTVALALAENKLMRDEVTKHINDRFKITPWHLTYGEGDFGTLALREHIAAFANEAFHPHQAITASTIRVCNGAGSAISNLAMCICEPEEGILIGRPLYNGFFPDLQRQANAKPVLVDMGDDDAVCAGAVQHYETAFLEAQRTGTTIRAILLSNPHNPLGRPYSKEALEGFLRLCEKYELHLISDEVYAKSWFPSTDFPEPPPFVSVLSLDIQQYCNPALVHVLYAMSKDFGANGIRIGCLISPFNERLRDAFGSISYFSRSSQLAEQAWLSLLADKPFLEAFFPELQKRMSDAYTYTTDALRAHGVPYNACSVGSFIWVDMSAWLEEETEDAELQLNWRMAKGGVWLSMGATFGSERYGWYRLTFATPRGELELGLERLFEVLDEVRP